MEDRGQYNVVGQLSMGDGLTTRCPDAGWREHKPARANAIVGPTSAKRSNGGKQWQGGRRRFGTCGE